MGSCFSEVNLNEDSSILANENISRMSLSPHPKFQDEISSPTIRTLSYDFSPDKASEPFEIRRSSTFSRPMLHRSLTNSKSLNLMPISPIIEENRQFPLRRSYTRTKTGIKSSYLGRARDLLRKTTVILDRLDTFKEEEESLSEESTGGCNHIVTVDVIEKIENYLIRHTGDLDPDEFIQTTPN